MPDGKLTPLTSHNPSTTLEDGFEGATKTIEFTAKQWASPSVKEKQNFPDQGQILPRMQNSLQEMSQAAPGLCNSKSEPIDLDMFLSRLKTHKFAISCMAFQDVWNVDLERIRDCCIHILSPDGRLIPFCMYNLTDAQGRSLYRPQI